MAGKANPIDVEQFLQKTHFPADKEELVQFVKNEHAPDPIVSAVSDIPERKYTSPQEAAKETFSPEKPEQSGPMGIDSCED
ncbi:MAG: DUF2795 domain-containing protein [Chitinispirillaceae bacterium]